MSKASEMLKKYLNRYRHVNWTLADQAMVSGVNFLTGILLVRFLGIEAFGQFTLVWMVVLFVNSIQMAMISSPMMSIGPKQDKQDEIIYYSALMLQQIIFSIITFLVLFLGEHLTSVIKPEWGINNSALPLALAGTFFQYQDFLRRYFFSRRQVNKAFINDVISYLGQIIILVYLFFTIELSVSQVLWVIALTSLFAIFYGLINIDFKLINYVQLKRIAKRNWKFSKWLTASAVMQWTSGNFFIVMAGVILGSSAVGALKAAQNIIGVTHIIFQGLENIVPINASREMAESGVNGLLKYLNKVFIFGGTIVAMICVLVWFLSDKLMLIVYGNIYQDYGVILQWYTVIYMLIFVCLPLRSGLRALEITRPIFIAYVFMSFFAFSFANLMIEKWQITGVLLGILGTQIIMVCALYVPFKYLVYGLNKR